MNDVACRVENLTVQIQKHILLESVDLTVPKGAIMGIAGPNGAGKSTLLKALTGLIIPTEGSVSFFGQSFKQARRKVAYMAQNADLDWDFPASVKEVVEMGTYGRAKLLRRMTDSDKDIVACSLEKTGLTPIAKRQISALSGGERQRTLLARALAQNGELFILDEPLAGVDVVSEDAIVKVLVELRDLKKTIILVHHDLVLLNNLCDSITILNKKVFSTSGSVRIDSVANLYNNREQFSSSYEQSAN